MKFLKFSCLFFFCIVFISCTQKPSIEDDSSDLVFRPLILRWKAESPDAENHPSKDACVIQITSVVMREPVVLESKVEELEYMVTYRLSGKNLAFEGIAVNSASKNKKEFRWTTTCGENEKVVVNFHNGQ